MKQSAIKLQLITNSRGYFKLFNQYKKQLISYLQDFDAEIHHIGSTAIPNLTTKGDLDILLLVKKKDFVKVCSKLLESYRQDNDNKPTKTYMGFITKNGNISVGIQAVVVGSKEETEFLEVKNVLLDNPKYWNEYNQLKKKFNGKSLEEYRQAKAKFINKILKSKNKE